MVPTEERAGIYLKLTPEFSGLKMSPGSPLAPVSQFQQSCCFVSVEDDD